MRRALLALSTAAVLSGCGQVRRTELASLPVPAAWPAGPAYAAAAGPKAIAAGYRELFTDPALQFLIARALQNNRDLRVAAANVAQARAQVRVVRSAQFPAVSAGASVDRIDSGGGGQLFNPGGGLGGGDLSSGAGGSARTVFGLQAGISAFEIDLFGRLSSATEAQRERLLASEAAAGTVRLALVADVTIAYLNLAADQELLAIAVDTARSSQSSVDLVRLRTQGGVAPLSDLRQAEQVLATARGDIAGLTTAIAQDRNLLALLVGEPTTIEATPDALSDLAPRIGLVDAGSSSTVLRRRPDLSEAEHLLYAADADLASVRADLFPRVTLGALAQLAAGSLGALFDAASRTGNAGADVGILILDGGARRGNVEAAQARRQGAIAAYERALQVAFREVSDALAAQGTVGERLDAAVERSTAAAATLRLVEAQYLGGVVNYLNNLDAQRSLYVARRDEVAVRFAALASRVAVYRVLGLDQTLVPL